MTVIRREIAAVVSVTFKTEKAAANRVARDSAWAAGFDTATQQHTVEIRSRWDADALLPNGDRGRTVHDVVFVTYALLRAEDVEDGAQGHVSGTRSSAYGKRIPYGYSARFQGIHESTGRLRALNYTGSLVVRDDETVTLLPHNSIPESECIEHLVRSNGTCVHCNAQVDVDEDDADLEAAARSRDADARTARVIRALLARDTQQRTFDINHTPVLTDAEREALDAVLFVLGV